MDHKDFPTQPNKRFKPNGDGAIIRMHTAYQHALTAEGKGHDLEHDMEHPQPLAAQLFTWKSAVQLEPGVFYYTECMLKVPCATFPAGTHVYGITLDANHSRLKIRLGPETPVRVLHIKMDVEVVEDSGSGR